MMDAFADDFFTELDLVEDPLAGADVPVDMPFTEGPVEPDSYSELWFGELDPGLPDVGGAVSDLPLPDPFQSGTGAGAGAAVTLARRLARRRGGAQSSPAEPGAGAGRPTSSAQTVAAVLQVADTTASLAQRLAGLRRRRASVKQAVAADR